MRYAVEENHRIRAFVELIRSGPGWATDLASSLLGELMYQSHQAYSECGLGSDATDLLVNLVRDESGLFGAKITGGGAGGTVAVLGRSGASDALSRVVQRYEKTAGIYPHVFKGTSNGADHFGVRQV
jgi:galactokinase